MLKPVARRLLNLVHVPRRLEALDAGQRSIGAQYAKALYPGLLPESTGKSALNSHEFRVYSQHGEDGILLYLFSIIGVKSRRFVEFGVEDGTECNTANLSINFGFRGMLMDGDAVNIANGRRFYDSMLGEHADAVNLLQSWIAADNINSILTDNEFTGEIDLLSIDIDGNDYWVWKAIDAVRPRIVIAEYNAGFGPARSVTIPYQPAFDRWKVHSTGMYFGASLAALTKLGSSKGYSLAGCDSSGANAFFVRDDLAAGVFAPITAMQAFYPQASRILAGHTQVAQEKILFAFPVEEV